MSSKVHPAGEEIAATSMAWRQADGPRVERMYPPPPGTGAALEDQASLAERERQIEVRVKSAFQQGQAASEAAANQRAAQRLDPVLASLAQMTQELAGFRKKFRADAEEDTVKLAIAVARRVLHRELSTDPEAILGLVIAAFQKLNARETYRLRLSPSGAATLQQYRDRLDLPPGLEILSESALTAGSVIFETSRGDLDASVDTQLAEIERGFADLMRRRAS